MPENLLQIPVQIARDAKRDVVDCIDGCSNTELLACSALLVEVDQIVYDRS